MQVNWNKCKFFFQGLQYIIPINIFFLIIFSILKLAFYSANSGLLTFAEKDHSYFFYLASLLSDLVILLPASILFGLMYSLAKTNWLKKLLQLAFIAYLFFAIVINIIDVFYFKFSNQRANANILYMLDHPLEKLKEIKWLLLLGALFAIVILGWLCYVIVLRTKNTINRFQSKYVAISSAVLLTFFCIFLFKKPQLTLPHYGLTKLSSNAALVAQNSFHSFATSLIRKGEDLPNPNYILVNNPKAFFENKAVITPYSNNSKNIVLFIMESVPFEFFDSTSKYKVDMPFFDALKEKSTFFSNAFCNSHFSNAGIVSNLASIPTITDVPWYQSSFTNMPKTAVGELLKKKNYSSFFCIGDGYDGFGFAKCANLLGIDNYYCREDLPNNKNLPSSAMGVHDEYVLDFMQNQINKINEPFFAINFNISTHYNYSLPSHFKKNWPQHYVPAMKSMAYYDSCISTFFMKAKKQSWFKNTVFIFSPDHWMYPDHDKITYHAVNNFRVPILIYDPMKETAEINNKLVSSMDVMPAILSLAGFDTTVSCFGKNLLSKEVVNDFVVTKKGTQQYQIIDSSYVLKYDFKLNKCLFLNNYFNDKNLKYDLKDSASYSLIKKRLEIQLKSYLQQAVLQYKSK
jgi:phosphoglycerol transferase MdoB-like AlkP superfamily enzyme